MGHTLCFFKKNHYNYGEDTFLPHHSFDSTLQYVNAGTAVHLESACQGGDVAMDYNPILLEHSFNLLIGIYIRL